jgi:hypothetical protein
MKKNLLMIVVFLAASLLTLTGTANMRCQAADTYTVTFRAGNVGTFRTGSVAESNQVQVAENYIKVKVPVGSTMTQVMATLNQTAQTSADMDYFFRQVANVKTDTVDQNEEYVLDYGTLVNPVEYKIQYVDSKTGNPISNVLISYGNDGDVIQVDPITIAGYTTQDQKQSFTLKKNGTNQISFKYVAGTQGNTTNTVYKEVPGNTIVNNQTRTTTVPVPTNAPAPANTPVPANTPAPTNIQDAGVPLADGTVKADGATKSDDKTTKTIDDAKTPLSSGDKETTSPYSYLKIIIPSALAIVVAAGAASILIRRRKKKLLAENSEKDR